MPRDTLGGLLSNGIDELSVAKFAALEPRQRYVKPEVIKSKWSVLPDTTQERVRSLFASIETPLLNRNRDDRRRIETQLALKSVGQMLVDFSSNSRQSSNMRVGWADDYHGCHFHRVRRTGISIMNRYLKPTWDVLQPSIILSNPFPARPRTAASSHSPFDGSSQKRDR